MVKKIIAMTILIFILSHSYVNGSNPYHNRTQGEVLSLSQRSSEQIGLGFDQIVRVKVLDGLYKDEIITINHRYVKYSITNFDLSIGKKVILEHYYDSNNELKWRIVTVWRAYYLKEFLFVFLFLLVIFGRIKGLMSLASLVFSGFVVIKYMIPLILKGHDAVLVAIVCSSVIIVVSFIMISGFTIKTLVATLGTVGGSLSAGVLSHLYSKVCGITGLVDEEVMFLVTNIGVDIDFRGLYMGGVIIGTIGVIMDVSMSIASFLFEIKDKSPGILPFDLFRSGLKVGKDVMSTMVNTLVLAYVGSSMPLIIMLVTSDTPLLQSVNSEIVAVEVIRSLAGSVGLILAIPLTSLLSCIFIYYKKTKNKSFR